MNGFIGKLILAYLRTKCPDISPLVMPQGRYWRYAVPNQKEPGRLLYGMYRPGCGELIKNHCDETLKLAGY